MRALSLARSLTRSFICAVIPSGMVSSVVAVPLMALSRSLVLSRAAFTLPFSPDTLAALSAVEKKKSHLLVSSRVQMVLRSCGKVFNVPDEEGKRGGKTSD